MAEKTKLWYLQNFNLFKSMAMEKIEEMSSKISMRESPKKQIIYFPEDPSNTIYLLKSGKVKIYRSSDDGKTTTFHLLGPGEIFGESALLGEEKRENVAEVVEDAVICTIDKAFFQKMTNENPQLNLSISKIIGFRIRKIQSQLEDLVFKTAKERIVAFLKRYTATFGKKMIDGYVVRPFLTHQEIANLTATTRQTVNSVLNSLIDEGSIKYSRRYLKILSDDWLN